MSNQILFRLIVATTFAALPAHAQYSVAIKSPANGAVVDCNKVIPMSGVYSAPNSKVAVTINDAAASLTSSTTFTYNMAQLFGKRTVTAKIFDTSVSPSVLKAQSSIQIVCNTDLPYALTVTTPANNSTVDCTKPIPVNGTFTAPQAKVAIQVNADTATISPTYTGGSFSDSLAQLFGKRTITVSLFDTHVTPSVLKDTKSVTIACNTDSPNFTPPPTTAPWTVNNTTHEIWIIPKNGNPIQSLNQVVAQLNTRTDPQNIWTVYLGAGSYTIGSTLRWDNLQRVNILSNKANPAVFQKPASGSYPEYLVQCLFCRNVKIDGITFIGRTSFATNVSPVWNDQGLFMPSTNTCTVSNNSFFNFGNAALRVTTYFNDPVKPVNSFNNVTQDNHFENIYQVTTTADNTIDHGGTSNYLVQRNTLTKLRGSLKFATRVKESVGIFVRNNSIDGGDNIGIEVSGYSDKVEITGNTIKNIKGYGISMYTNDRVKKGTEYEWGNNYIIRGNAFAADQGGIHFNNAAYTAYSYIDSNGDIAFADYAPSQYIQFMSHNLTVDANSFDSMTGRLVNLKWVDGASITNNKITNNKYPELVYYNPFTTNVVQSGNTLDGKPVNLVNQ